MYVDPIFFSNLYTYVKHVSSFISYGLLLTRVFFYDFFMHSGAIEAVSNAVTINALSFGKKESKAGMELI